jgi:catechol 2,3-dioxygenase-like lactoylglutathione lyase family enzyme
MSVARDVSQKTLPLPSPGAPFIPDAWSNPLVASNESNNFNHTAIRVSSVERSSAFYTDFLSLSLFFALNTGPFTAYSLGLKRMGSSAGFLELVYAHEDDSLADDDEKGCVSGKEGEVERDVPIRRYENTQGKMGFAHLGFRVPNVGRTLERARNIGYKVLKMESDVRISHMQPTKRGDYLTPKKAFKGPARNGKVDLSIFSARSDLWKILMGKCIPSFWRGRCD